MDDQVKQQIRDAHVELRTLYPNIVEDGVEYTFAVHAIMSYPFYPFQFERYQRDGIRMKFLPLHPSKQDNRSHTHKAVFVAVEDAMRFCELESREHPESGITWLYEDGTILPNWFHAAGA